MEELLEVMRIEFSNTSTSFDKVLTELYQLFRRGDETKSDPAPATRRENEAFLRGGRKDTIPQYCLKTVTTSETLVHIIPDDRFGYRNDGSDYGDDTVYPRVGESWYTGGMIWTNADPDWEWSGMWGDDDRKWRCRIEIPAGTQVIMDRSPVGLQWCEMEDGKKSLFPDVLLAPGEFYVKSVTRYKTRDKDSNDEEGVVYLPAVDPDEKTDRFTDYHRRFLGSDPEREFVDVNLLLQSSMVLPTVD